MLKISSLFLIGFFSACIIDTVPVPDWRPQDSQSGDTDKIPGGGDDGTMDGYPPASEAFLSNLFYSVSEPMLLVGVENSVPSLATVLVKNESQQNWWGSIEASANGSFNLPIFAFVGDTIIFRVFDAGTELFGNSIYLEPASVAANGAAEDLATLGASPEDTIPAIVSLVVTAPDASGMATIAGPIGGLEVGIQVVIANLAVGESTSANVLADGSFYRQIKAESGDPLWIFAAEPASSSAGGTPIVVNVP